MTETETNTETAIETAIETEAPPRPAPPRPAPPGWVCVARIYNGGRRVVGEWMPPETED